MSRQRSLQILWILSFFTFTNCVFGKSTSDIQIYLPGEKTVLTDAFNLGQIATVLADQKLSSIINQIPLGKFVLDGQDITIDRTTILSRLASVGIDTKSVTFNGAEKVLVQRDQTIVSADRFLQTAREFLRKQLKNQNIISLKPVRSAQDFSLSPDCGDIELIPQMISSSNGRTYRVGVSVMRQGIALSRQEIVFSVQYTSQRLVALQDLEAGTLISPSNTITEEYVSNLPPKESQALPYGMVVRGVVRKGTVISNAMVESKVSPVLIKPRQHVMMKLETGGLYISAPGIAMQEGRIGEIIRVQRGSRQTRDERIIVGKVMPDGTIRPVL